MRVTRLVHSELATARRERRARKETALDPDAIYLGDNGRAFCGAPRCAGMTAQATGRDLSGQRVHRLTIITFSPNPEPIIPKPVNNPRVTLMNSGN